MTASTHAPTLDTMPILPQALALNAMRLAGTVNLPIPPPTVISAIKLLYSIKTTLTHLWETQQPY